jgi:hypothetical protein
MATQKMTVFWADAAGLSQARTYTTAAGATALVAALQAKSNAVAADLWEGTEVTSATPATAAQFPTVQAVAYLRFTDGAGHTATVALPAPQGSIFLSDGFSVDPTQIAAIIAQAIGVVETAAGTLVTAFDSGWLGTGPGTPG